MTKQVYYGVSQTAGEHSHSDSESHSH